MESIKKIYKIGYGPSSSHTMGPRIAAETFKKKNPTADSFVCELYGSLALTGKGHFTDIAIKEVLGISTIVNFNYNIYKKEHSNAMELKAYCNDKLVDSWLVYSIGGGEIRDDSNLNNTDSSIYKETSMDEILSYCNINNIDFVEYINRYESDLFDYLDTVFEQMIITVESGLNKKDILPGELKIRRRANHFYKKYLNDSSFSTLLFAASLASSEENASENLVVTAPTCGSCGVIAGLVYSYYKTGKYTKDELVKSLAVAGLIGNLIKTNASISGSLVGCQGEVGAACSMAAAMVCYLMGGSIYQIEYAAEIGLEHNLGMTCDPVNGYVQIPCIERNAMASKTAITCAEYAYLSNGEHYITLDSVIESMMATGLDLSNDYKETSKGGLAKVKLNK